MCQFRGPRLRPAGPGHGLSHGAPQSQGVEASGTLAGVCRVGPMGAPSLPLSSCSPAGTLQSAPVGSAGFCFGGRFHSNTGLPAIVSLVSEWFQMLLPRGPAGSHYDAVRVGRRRRNRSCGAVSVTPGHGPGPAGSEDSGPVRGTNTCDEPPCCFVAARVSSRCPGPAVRDGRLSCRSCRDRACVPSCGGPSGSIEPWDAFSGRVGPASDVLAACHCCPDGHNHRRRGRTHGRSCSHPPGW